MAKREVTVVINGEEYVSKATGEADAALGGFSAKIPGYAKVVAGMAVAYQAVQAVIGKVRDVVVESFAAYDELATSQRKIEGTSKIAGVSMDVLRGIASKARDEFRLSTVTANELASVTALMGAKAGDASKANQLLSSALDIGAARGMNARDVMDALNLTLKGQDEGLDKLVNANPSVLYKEWAESTGVAVGKMDDQQKMLAIIEGLTQRGTKVGGEYVAYLQTAQGKQAQLNEQLTEMKAKLGEAMQPMRAFVVDALGEMVTQSGNGVSAVSSLTHALVAFLGALKPIVQPVLTLGTVLLQVFSVGTEQILISIRRLSGGTAVAVGNMIASFGTLAERGGKFLRILGIDVVADTGESLRKFGEDMVSVNQNKLLRVEFDALNFKDRQKRLWEEWRGNTTSTAQAAMTGVETAVTTATPKVEAAAASMGRSVEDKLGKPLKISLEMTKGALDRLSEAARDQLPVKPAQDFGAAMDGVRKNADLLIQRMGPLNTETQDAADNTKGMAREVETLARGALDAATSFGVIDDNAARSLNSAVNIASAVQKMATSGFSFAGAVGVIGGVASIVNTMMAGDAERRRLLRENNVSLARLSKDIGGLNLNVTGEDFATAQGAIGGLTFKGGMANFGTDAMTLSNALQGAGMTLSQLERIGNELGINIKDKNGNLSFEAIRQLQTALSTVKPGRLGSDFNSQLDFFKESQRIDGATGTGGINGLLDFLRNVGGVTALDGLNADDPQALRSALRNLFVRLNNGEGVQGLGRLTGSGFMQILTSLIDDLDGLASDSTSGGASGGGDTSAPTGATETPEQKAKRERDEARQKKLDEIELKSLQVEEVLSNLRKQKVTEETKTKIAMYEQMLDDIREEERAVRRRFKIEDLSGNFAPIVAGAIADAVTGGGSVVTAGGVSVSTETVQAVIGAMNTNLGTILTAHTAIHERVAMATESSAVSLRSIDNKMDNLIAVTAGQIDATDAKLEAMRRMAALERGERPVLG